MREELVITGLLIDRMYGRPINLRLDDLTGGVNILFGPNGSGKTTLARGIESVLWPSAATRDGRIIDASMRIDDVRWTAALERDRAVWRREGRECDAPPLPPMDQRDRYQLLLPELIASEDESFARLVMREMVGGVDVRAAADTLKFKIPSPRRTSATETAEQRAQKVRDLVGRQSALRSDRERLGKLASDLERALNARRTIDYLDKLLEALSARDARQEAEQTLSAFPNGLAELLGNEMERLGEYRGKREDSVRDLEAAREAIESNLGVINSSSLEGPIPEDALVELDGVVRRIEKAESKVDSSLASLEGAREVEQNAWNHLEIGVEREQVAALDVTGFEEVSGFVRKKREAEARSEARRRFIELIGEPPPADSTDDLKEAAGHLLRWAEATSKHVGVRSAYRVGLIAAGLLHIVVGAVLGVLWSPVAVLLILAGLGAAWLAWRLPTGPRESIADEHRRNFERTGVEGPESWQQDSVFQALDDLQKKIVESRWSDLLRNELRRVRDTGESDDEVAALEEVRQGLLEHTGLDAGLSEEGLTYVVGRIHAWQKAMAKVGGATAELDEARVLVKRLLDRFHEAAKVYGENRPTDAAEAGAAVSRLRGADSAYREAAGALKQARQQVNGLASNLKTIDDQIEALFTRAGLEPGDEAGLAELCRRKEAYDRARDVLSEAVGAEKNRLDTVRGHELFEQNDVELSTEAVESRIEALRDPAEQVDTLRDDIRSIEQEISRAEKSHDLELARSELDEALVALDRERVAHFRSMAGAMLADFVSEQTYDHQLPAVFKRARSIFSDVTAGRYELRFRDESFSAYDRIIEQEHRLGELSTGTRVQLLLSVRIAFIEEQERGIRLPIVLDETLANSDDSRADAIVRTVLDICRTGRQVFYLTARDDEVAQWKRVLEQMGDIESRIVVLDGSHEPATYVTMGQQHASETAPAFSKEIPVPAGRDHAEYGRELGIAPWSPYAPTGTLHVWYLIDDVEALHRLLSAGYERWGQLRGLIRDGDPSVIGLDANDIQAISERAEAIEAWRSAWSIGRGRPVDASVLEQSGAVSDKFLDDVSTLATEVSFDGAAIIRALRDGAVSGFYSSKMDELERWLIEHDYIDESNALDPDEVWTHTVRTMSDRMAEAGLTIEELKRVIRRITQARPTPSHTAGPSEA